MFIYHPNQFFFFFFHFLIFRHKLFLGLFEKKIGEINVKKCFNPAVNVLRHPQNFKKVGSIHFFSLNRHVLDVSTGFKLLQCDPHERTNVKWGYFN